MQNWCSSLASAFFGSLFILNQILASPAYADSSRSSAIQSQSQHDAGSCRLSTIEVKLIELEGKYGVRIGRAADKEGSTYRPAKQSRTPRQDELRSLEYALIRLNPLGSSELTAHGGNIEIIFLNSPLQDHTAGCWCIYKKHTVIYIASDYEKFGISLVELLMHELAHNDMYKMGFKPDHPFKWQPSRELGWLPFHNPDTGLSGWMIKTKQSEHYFYRTAAYSDDWVRCDRRGRALREDNQLVNTFGEACVLENSQIAAIALITPATDYFDNPMEMIAEGLMLFRQSAASRAGFRAACPQFYSFIKNLDQSALDQYYGEGVMVRTACGIICPAGEPILAQLTQFESADAKPSSSNVIAHHK